CELRSEGDPTKLDSVTGALAPPQSVLDGASTTQRRLFPHKGGQSVERDVHFFWMRAESDSGKPFILGIVTECSASALVAGARHLDASRHLVWLHRRFGLGR